MCNPPYIVFELSVHVYRLVHNVMIVLVSLIFSLFFTWCISTLLFHSELIFHLYFTMAGGKCCPLLCICSLIVHKKRGNKKLIVYSNFFLQCFRGASLYTVHNIIKNVKIIQLNEWRCRDAPCERSSLSNTIKDTSTIMRHPYIESLYRLSNNNMFTLRGYIRECTIISMT